MIDNLEAIGVGRLSRSPTVAMIGVASRAFHGQQLAWLLFPMAAIVFVGPARGALVTQYSFTDVVVGTLNRSATTVAANVTAGNITDAPTVNGNPTVILQRLNGVGYATQPSLAATRAAFNEANDIANVYFSFVASPDSGYELDLDKLTFNVARGGAATPRTYDVRSSVDGFAASLVSGPVAILTVRPNFTSVSIDLSGSAFQNLTSPLTFRIHYMGQVGQFGQAIDFDDITLNGTVAATAIPEASTLPVLALVVAWMCRIGARRRS